MIARNIYFVQKDKVTELGPDQLALETIGGKALGLCDVPIAWSVPFFVVSKEMLSEYADNNDRLSLQPYIDNIKKTIDILQFDGGVILRSSAIDEGMSERGRFDSVETSIDNLEKSLFGLLDVLKEIPNKGMPIVVQQLINSKFTGHMSNERRFSLDSRDWKVETYYGDEKYEQDTIAIRSWRTKYSIDEIAVESLRPSSKHLNVELQKVAYFWYELSKKNKCRFHLEFVFDGVSYYIVQSDRDKPKENAVNPKQFDIKIQVECKDWTPKVLKKFAPEKQSSYKKLDNVKRYYDLGFCTVPLYFLDDTEVLHEIKNKKIRNELKEDLEALLGIQSVVIRMDIESNDRSKKQLLPRSNEVRNYSDVILWLEENVEKILGEDCGIFIFHNFVPAISSAFAHASPGGRLVRIQSLWGLPEGLYYNYHDTIIVDLGTNDIDLISKDDVKVTIKNKFKDSFIFPDVDGTWVSKEIKEPYDWRCSIEKNESIFDIAVKSQKLSNSTQKEISVMWFVGIDNEYYGASNLPWYHEEVNLGSSYTADSYKRKYFSDEELVINNSEELQALITSGNIEGKRCFRLKPNCEKDLRNRKLIESIGELSVKYDIMILLDGTQLTHSYYQLKKTGAHVVCSNNDELVYSDTLEFNKLVRDKIPEKIISNGEHVKCSRLSRPLYDRMLLEKLLEEAYEVFDAITTADIVSELADMIELCDTIKELNDQSSLSCYDVLRINQNTFYDGYLDEKVFCIDDIPNKIKSFRFKTLYGNIIIQRQKTQYRIEFNFQNSPLKQKSSVALKNEPIFEMKKKIIREVSIALNSKTSQKLMQHIDKVCIRINELCEYLGQTILSVNEKKLIKKEKVGGFREGYVLNQTALKDNIIDDMSEFNPNQCPEIYYLERDNNKYFEFLRNLEKQQKRLLFRFVMPIAVNEWEIVFDNPRIVNVLPNTGRVKFAVRKSERGRLFITFKTCPVEEYEQLSIFDVDAQAYNA